MSQPSPIRVAINAIHAKAGGGVTYLRNMLPLLAKDDRLELHLIIHDSQRPLFEPLPANIALHCPPLPHSLAKLMLWEQLRLPGLIRSLKADVVYSPANYGCLALRAQVILLQNVLSVIKVETRWSKRLYWLALGVLTVLSHLRVRKAIAVSRYAGEELSLGILAAKTSVVHHGVDGRFCPAAVPREDFLLAVSDIYVQKNLHNLLRALRLVCDRHPQTVLVIAGQPVDQWYFDRTQELAAELGLSDNIRFVGRQALPDLIDLYRRCRALVFPSSAESFGMPLVEAMACGTPIASSSATAMPEIIGDAGLLFAPDDVEAMAAAVLRLMEDEELRASLSAKGLERAKHFSWPLAARQTADILVEATRRRYTWMP